MFVFHGGSALAALSGVGLVLLGLGLRQIVTPSRQKGAFAAFALIWGLSVIFANITNLVDDAELAVGSLHVSFVLLAFLYLPLMRVLLHESGRSDHWSIKGPTQLVAFVPLVAVLLIYSSDPALFVAGGSVRGGRIVTELGPLGAAFGTITGTVIFVAACFVATRRLRATSSEPRRSRVALLAAGFTFYASYRTSDLVRYGVDIEAFSAAGLNAFILGAAAITALLACGYAALIALRDPSLPWRGLILAGATIPFLFGLSEIFFDQIGVVGFRTVGLWRLITAGILAYGIARYRLFDAELRVSAAAPALAFVAAAFVGVALLWAFLGARLVSSPLLGTAATFGVVLACVPAATLGRRAVERRGAHVGDIDYLYKRKVDVYRAALEDSASHGIGEKTEQELLSNLRRALGISEQEHRILMLVIQSQDKYAKKPPASATTIGEKFRVERELGRGAHGSALLARDVALDRQVVLKQPMAPWLLDDEGRARFVAEARLAARISHPNVVTVHEVLAQTEPPTIVMEYMAGGSLEEKLRGGAKLLPADATRIGREILAGLGAVHAAGMVHRDLKPANVLLDAHGVAKIGDFGTAQPPEEWRAMATIGATVAGQPGTPAYMSPEQARGEEVDARSDLYSVGAILYRMLTGEHYIDVRKLSEPAARAAVQDQPPRLPHPAVAAPIERVLRKALAKERAQRFESASEMAKELAAASATRTIVPVDAGKPLVAPDRTAERT